MYICLIPWRGDIKKWSTTRPTENLGPHRDATPNNKKELQAFLGITNYFSKFYPIMARVCEPLWKLMSSGAVWMWNTSYQALYDKMKSLIKAEICMKFETKPLYFKTDASGIGLDTTLLQTRDVTRCLKDIAPDNTILRSIMFLSKSLTSAE